MGTAYDGDALPALRLTVNPGNQASTVFVLVKDADGTLNKYEMPLPGTPGAHRVTPAAGATLAEPTSVDTAGDTPGLDLSKIDQVQVLGDWQASTVDVTFEGVFLDEAGAGGDMPPEPGFGAADAPAMSVDPAAARAALASFRRTPGSPTVEHVALVAPDLLSLTIHAGDVPRRDQVAYRPQPGDEVVAEPDHDVIAWRDGELVVEALNHTLHRKVDGTLQPVAYLDAGREWMWEYDRMQGEPLVEVLADRAQGYSLSSTDDPAYADAVAPTAVFRKSKPTYQVDPGRVDATMVHRVFLRLPQPLTDGKTYTIGLDEVNTRDASVEYRHEPRSTRTDALHATQIGYRPDDGHKVAYLSMWLGTGGGMAYDAEQFELLDASGRTVHAGAIEETKGLGEMERLEKRKDFAKTAVYALDFSHFGEPGEYRVYLPGVGTSGPFPIGEGVWEDAFEVSMLGFLHHRSGIELGPPLTDYVRPRPFHPADGVEVFELDVDFRSEWDGVNESIIRLTDGGKKPRSQWPATNDDAWGGYMDAGDWDRRIDHLSASYLHLELLELFPGYFEDLELRVPAEEAGNRLPDLLDEALFNVSFYKRIQDDDGGVSGGVESAEHPREGELSWQESLAVGVYAPDVAATFTYAGPAAKLARLAEPYDKSLATEYARSAVAAWRWGQENREASLKKAFDRERMKREALAAEQLAAVELLWLTGEQKYADRFAELSSLGSGDQPPSEAAAFTYARLPDGVGSDAIKQAAREHIVRMADGALSFAAGNSFGLVNAVPAMPMMGYLGYLSTPGVQSQAVPRAYALTGEEKYLDATVQSANLSAGANPDNMTYTTGVGRKFPLEPLHIDSRMSGQPAPAGITVYGPSDPSEPFAFDAWMHKWFLSEQMTPDSRAWPFYESYVDAGRWPAMNEYTVHQTMGPTSYTWGFLAARAGSDAPIEPE